MRNAIIREYCAPFTIRLSTSRPLTASTPSEDHNCATGHGYLVASRPPPGRLAERTSVYRPGSSQRDIRRGPGLDR
jgi:hypothetical protein